MGPGAIHPLHLNIRLALISLAAACVATFCAAILEALMIIALTLSPETGGIGALFEVLLYFPPIAIFSIGAALDVMPLVVPAAALVGAVLWKLGGRHLWVRRRVVWAAVGAMFALAVLAAMRVGILPDFVGALHDSEQARLAASFVLSGAGAALIFRAGLHFLALFFLAEEGEPNG